MILSTMWIDMNGITYISWIVMAFKVFAICAAEALLINLIFYKGQLLALVNVRRNFRE